MVNIGNSIIVAKASNDFTEKTELQTANKNIFI